MAYVLRVRNVNEALNQIMVMLIEYEDDHWMSISPRGQSTLEWIGTFITEYQKPDERVLFSGARDANPFFHFFESLWILNGSRDVAYLKQFNSNIEKFSDDGKVFHAPYGYRLRYHFGSDQIAMAIKLLREDYDTRQVVLSIWDTRVDLGKVTKDLPCNDTLFLKIRDGRLNITVCCRSNDIIWGAYGANAVQFSMLQEFIASAVGVGIGTYTQVSDSFHAYTSNEAYQRLLKVPYSTDLYKNMTAMRPYPILKDCENYVAWLAQLDSFVHNPWGILYDDCGSFFFDVAAPMWRAWHFYKVKKYDDALKELDMCCRAYDWATACSQWITRRINRRII